MTLLNVETNTKHGCLSKLAKSIGTKINTYPDYIFNSFIQGYPSVCGADLWTSGSNFGTDDYAWASGKKPLRQSELNWKSGQPKRTDGDCVFLQFSNQSANASTYSLGNCAEEKNFTCEVYLFDKTTHNVLIILCYFSYRKEKRNPTPFKKNAWLFMTSATVIYNLSLENMFPYSVIFR